MLMLCLAAICFMSLPIAAQAASQKPPKVTSLKATAGESQVTLRWTRLTSATGYYIYVYNEEESRYERFGKTTNNTASYTAKKLKNSTPYTFKVSAYRKVKSKIYEGSKSGSVTVTPKVTKPGTPLLSRSSIGNKYVQVKWDKVTSATGYQIYQKSSATGKYKSIGTTEKTLVKIKKLTNGKTYDFKVRAYREISGVTRYGEFSNVITATPFSVSSAVSSELKTIHSMYYTATVLYNTYVKSSKGKTVALKAGSTVTVTKRGTTCTIQVPGDTSATAQISIGYLNFTRCITEYSTTGTFGDYSLKAKEAFVNSKYSSATDYLIWISLPKQRLYIFKKNKTTNLWELDKDPNGKYRNWLCATGMAATPTPPGRYTIHRKAPFFKFDEDCYANDASFFSGNAIHSWLFTFYTQAHYNDGERPGKPGAPASHGCVRLDDQNAKWVYDNIPIGTTCIIY